MISAVVSVRFLYRLIASSSMSENRRASTTFDSRSERILSLRSSQEFDLEVRRSDFVSPSRNSSDRIDRSGVSIPAAA